MSGRRVITEIHETTILMSQPPVKGHFNPKETLFWDRVSPADKLKLTSEALMTSVGQSSASFDVVPEYYKRPGPVITSYEIVKLC